ncbi:MAG: Two-component transcriptional response regulator, LuxR family, partial [uncultured Solirubrobacteraceae bacterium]
DPHADRRRSGARPRRPAGDARGARGHRGDRGGGRRGRGGRAGRAAAAGRRPDGHPHAPDGRHRGHAPPHGAPGGAARPDPHHLRRRRVRLRGDARRRGGLPAQGHLAGPARRRDPHRGGGRGAPRPDGHPAARRALRAPARPGARGWRHRLLRADLARARHPPPRRARALQRRDRLGAVPLRGDREDPRDPHPRQARAPRPGAGGRARLRDRPRRAGRRRL